MKIDGIKELEGKGISYCAICDGFFYKGKNVVVIGNGKFAISEAKDLENIAGNVKILTNGENIDVDTEFEVITKPIDKNPGIEYVPTQIFTEYIRFMNNYHIDGIIYRSSLTGGRNVVLFYDNETSADILQLNNITTI